VMVQCSNRWVTEPSHGAEDALAALPLEPVPPDRIRHELLDDGRLELAHVRRLLDDLTASRFAGELDSWSQRRYEALCNLERELLGLHA
jgi:hypothetical protein